MAGVKGKSGRHTGDIKREGYYFRLRPEVVARVERCTPLLELEEGVRMSKAEALEHLLTMACEALERTREGREAPAPMPIADVSASQILKIAEISGDDVHVPGYGFPEDEEERQEPAPASHVNGQGALAPQPTAQPAIPLALEPAPKTAHPVDVPQAAETPEPRKTPMIPTGMQQCPLDHAPYPMSQSECPTCGRERQRSQRTVSQQPEGEVMPMPGYEVRPRHSVVTEDVPAPEAPAQLASASHGNGTGAPEPSVPMPQVSEAPTESQNGEADIPPYDTSKYALGKLCPRGHDYHGTGQSLRHLRRHVCLECDAEGARERRKAKRQGQPA